jgi:hypothetical protein
MGMINEIAEEGQQTQQQINSNLIVNPLTCEGRKSRFLLFACAGQNSAFSGGVLCRVWGFFWTLFLAPFSLTFCRKKTVLGRFP